VHASEQYILLAEQALKLAKTEISEGRRRAIVDIALAWSRLAQDERVFAIPPQAANEAEPRYS
jgi:hypothetical protein